MKNKIIKVLSKPKIVIPIFALISIVVIIIGYKNIGKAPIVNINPVLSPLDMTNSLGNISLSFPKGGRIEKVTAKEGQIVYAGEVLATLSAPDAQGAIDQAKGALDLAQAEYASLNLQYQNTKAQQDLIVKNAYQTLLSGGLEGVPSIQDLNSPIISGTYSCGKEGSYVISPYRSGDSDTGVSFNYSGLESGVSSVKYDNPIALGKCGLQIKFKNINYFNTDVQWTIDIPNTKGSVYLVNKNTYDLAKENRDKILSELSATIGTDNGDISIAKAKVSTAFGAYKAALGIYQNNVIKSPVNGTISFVDKDLKVGQSVVANKNIISITTK